MMPSYFYTALIDVLSYRFRLERDVKSGAFSFKSDLEKSLSVFNNVNTAVYTVQAISDTIIITCNTHNNFPEFLDILKSVFISFLKTGLFIRGGVAYSKHFQSGRITYSHAISRAYELENKLAIYPRIVIDENIVQMYRSGNNLPQIFDQGLLAVQNGITFLNVIDKGNWKEAYDFARSIYENDESSIIGNESAFQKHQWFEKYIFDSPFALSGNEAYVTKMKLI
jgi:hypothetical protein